MRLLMLFNGIVAAGTAAPAARDVAALLSSTAAAGVVVALECSDILCVRGGRIERYEARD